MLIALPSSLVFILVLPITEIENISFDVLFAGSDSETVCFSIYAERTLILQRMRVGRFQKGCHHFRVEQQGQSNNPGGAR